MDMPDKIWVTERHEEMDHPMLRAGMWTNGPMHSRETQYIRTDIAQSLADALEGIMRDLPSNKDWLDPVLEAMAKDALANYRKEE